MGGVEIIGRLGRIKRMETIKRMGRMGRIGRMGRTGRIKRIGLVGMITLPFFRGSYGVINCQTPRREELVPDGERLLQIAARAVYD